MDECMDGEVLRGRCTVLEDGPRARDNLHVLVRLLWF
jgi:hypothetical protein